MRSGKIIGIIEKIFKKISKLFKSVREDFNADDIHDFRTTIKKLRSFIRLLKCGSSNPDKLKIPKKLKSVYTYNGAIRTLQLQCEHIRDICNKKNLPEPEGYLEFLEHEEQDWKRKTGSRMERISLKAQQEKLLKHLPESLRRKHIKAFISSNNKELHRLFSLPFFYDDALHEIRKRLKDLQYNWKYIEEDAPIIVPAYLANPDNIKFLTDKLGDFHDRCMALHLLEPIYTRHAKNETEANTLKAVILHLSHEKEEMKDDAIKWVLQLKKWSKGWPEAELMDVTGKNLA